MSAEQQGGTDYIVMTQETLSAIIGHCLVNAWFLRHCSKNLKKSHLNHAMLADIYDYVTEYYGMYSCAPTVPEMENHFMTKHPDLTTYTKYRLAIAAAVEKRDNFKVEGLASNIRGWLKLRVLRNSIGDQTKFFNQTNYQKAEQTLNETIIKLRDTNFEDEDRAVSDNMIERLEAFVNHEGEGCTFGHPDLDNIILDGAKREYDKSETDLKKMTKGCMLAGEITILLGPSNSGKTTTLRTIAIENVMQGKDVCYVSHEESEDKMMRGLFQTFLEIQQEEMLSKAIARDQEFLKRNEGWNILSKRHLYYHEYIKPGKMFVEDVLDLIQSSHEKLMLSNGKGFDLVIVDYPSKTRSRESSKNAREDTVIEYVYEQYRLLARKNQFHVLAPIQTNREGFKQNKDGGLYLDMDNGAGSFGVMTIGDAVVSINRTSDDQSAMRIKYFVAKSRNGEAKRVFMSETRFDLGKTHGVGYGAVIFRGSEVDANDDIEKLLAGARYKTGKILEERSKAAEAKSFSRVGMIPPNARGTVNNSVAAAQETKPVEPLKPISEIKYDSQGNEIK